MTDKALEAATAQFLKDEGYTYGPDDLRPDSYYAKRIKAVISAYLSALPGEAEVVAWLGTNLDGESEPFLEQRQAEFWSNGACHAEPLVTLASLQAMQARAVKAEGERDEAQDRASAWAKEEGQRQIELGTALSRAEAVEACVKVLEEALKPFAAYIEARDENDSDFPDDARVVAYARNLREAAAEVTVGDFRRARAALPGGSNG